MGQNPNPLNDIIKLHVSSTSVVNYVIKTMEKENIIYKEQIQTGEGKRGVGGEKKSVFRRKKRTWNRLNVGDGKKKPTFINNNENTKNSFEIIKASLFTGAGKIIQFNYTKKKTRAFYGH